MAAAPLLTFRIGAERMAVPAAQVSEVARLPRMVRVPHAPDSLLGVANVRGSVVPIVSLAKLLGHADAGAEAGRLIVLSGEHPVGLAVDEVSAVAAGGAATPIDVAPLLARAFGEGRQASRTRARVSASTSAAAAENRIALVSFAVAGQEFALPLEQVEQVMRLPDTITALPGGDEVALGTVAVGGVLLPLLSLAALLGLPTREAERRSRVLVVRIGPQRIGLLVEAMRAVLQVEEAVVDAVPAALARGGAEARIQAICRLDEGRRLVSVLAADHLLRADLTARLHQSGDSEVTANITGDQGETEGFLLFRIGEEEFALPLASVEEVALLPERLTRLPKAPAFVEGVMNLRGRVLPVIDQRRRFRGDAAASERRRRVIVVRAGELDAAFIVDAVSEVLRIPAARIRPAPGLGEGGARVFDRIANLEEEQRLILIVSPQELLDRAERDLLAGLRSEEAPENP